MKSKYLDKLSIGGVIEDYNFAHFDDGTPGYTAWLPIGKSWGSGVHGRIDSAYGIRESLKWVEDCDDENCEPCTNPYICPDDCTLHQHNARRINNE